MSWTLRLYLIVGLCVVFLGTQPAAAQTSPQERTAPQPQEIWTELSVKKLGMQAEPPQSGGKAEFPEFTRELVRLQWRAGDPVDVHIVQPRGVKKPRVVLYLYTYLADSTRFTNPDWCKAAVEGGIAAVGFVSALSADRFHSRPMKQWFVSELAEALGNTTHDVQMIIDYLQSRDDLNAERVAVYAQGSGASIAILAASVDPRIAVLDLLDPWGDWPNWLKESRIIPQDERATYLRPEFLAQAAKLEPVIILPQLRTQTIRIQQVGDDRITPRSAQDRIAAAAPRPEQVVRYQNTVTFRKAWQEQHLWAWAKEQLLRPSPAPLNGTKPPDVAQSSRSH